MLDRFNLRKTLRVFTIMEKRLWVYFLGILGYCIAQSGLVIGMSYVYRYMGRAVEENDTGILYTAGYIILGVLLAVCVLSPVLRYIYGSQVRKTMAALRRKLFDHITRLPVRYFEDKHSGDTISRITSDIQVLEIGLLDHVQQIFFTVILTIGALVTMFVTSWKVSLILIGLSTVSIAVNRMFASKLRGISFDLQNKLGLLTERFTDIISGFFLMKMFNIHEIISGKVEKENRDVKNTSVKRVRYFALQESSNTFIAMLNMIGAVAIGAVFVYQKRMDSGMLLQFIQLQTTLSMVIAGVGEYVGKFQTALAGADRMFELADMPREEQSVSKEAGKGTGGETDAMVSFDNVAFGYDENKKALHGVTFSISKGSVAALVGPSGGGKSTVIKLIMGFYPVEKGRIMIDRKPAEAYTLEELRDMISYVPQDAYLFDGTIEENILYGKPDAAPEDIAEAAKAANAHDFIMEQPEGYKTPVGERGSKLSGGQKQRIAIARAILKNAPILLLDEATSALDSESEQLVQGALDRLMEGRTVIVVAHRLSTIQNADEIFVIDSGSIAERGNHHKLLPNGGLYSKLHRMQFKAT